MTLTPASVLNHQLKTMTGWLISESKKFHQTEWLWTPPGLRNHAWWLFGHLAVHSDFEFRLERGTTPVPGHWESLFAIGSVPHPRGEGYPEIAEVVEVLKATLEKNRVFISKLDDAYLEGPPPETYDRKLAEFFPTPGSYLYFQPAHIGYHLGQIRDLGAQKPASE